MIEKAIEEYLTHQAIRSGALCFKFVSPGNIGVPDRIVIYQGAVYFVELKRPDGKLRTAQIHRCSQLRKHGAAVYAINTKEEVDSFITMMKKRGDAE